MGADTVIVLLGASGDLAAKKLVRGARYSYSSSGTSLTSIVSRALQSRESKPFHNGKFLSLS